MIIGIIIIGLLLLFGAIKLAAGVLRIVLIVVVILFIILGSIFGSKNPPAPTAYNPEATVSDAA